MTLNIDSGRSIGILGPEGFEKAASAETSLGAARKSAYATDGHEAGGYLVHPMNMAASKQHRLLDAGARAPEFRLQRLDGGDATLQELTAAGPVLLAFLKISCPVCQFTFPYLERLHQAGSRVYGISQNDADDTREFNREFGITFPMLLDDEDADFPTSNAYGISHVPTMFLVDGEKVTRVIEGWQRKEMERFHVIRQGENVPAWKAG